MKTFRQRCGFFAVCFLTWFVFSAVGQQADSGQSLGDVARKLRKDTTSKVKMTDTDTKKLFESVDKIFAFAAEDTAMPKRAVVKRQLVRIRRRGSLVFVECLKLAHQGLFNGKLAAGGLNDFVHGV
jgi:hypothetical protein